MLDWELCTLGDPLADVGYLGVYWYDGSTETARPNDPTPAGGFPPYADILERYARRTGRDVSGIGYYIAFGCWRLAVISEGVYARYLHGAMGDERRRRHRLVQGRHRIAGRASAGRYQGSGL